MKALIVDGYNAINKISSVKALMDESLLSARNKITQLAREYKRKCGGVDKLFVVFDGRDEYRGQVHDNALPEQIFSKRGEGDKEIVRLVKNLSGQYHVIVISDDNFVRNNSRAYNATILKVSESLSTLKKKGSKKRDGSGEKVSPKDASEINRFLKKHWNL